MGKLVSESALKAAPARYAGAIRTKRNTSILPTPSLRVPGFEDEDDDEDEYEAPHERDRGLIRGAWVALPHFVKIRDLAKPWANAILLGRPFRARSR